jgi:hypothetical protein
MNSENARQGEHSLTRILQGKQSDPKESNALLNPILERPPEAKSRGGDAPPPLREEMKGVIQRKEESVMRREEPGTKEDRGSIDGYGLNSVKVHDSNSHSSKDKERQSAARRATRKFMINLIGAPTTGNKKVGLRKKPTTNYNE